MTPLEALDAAIAACDGDAALAEARARLVEAAALLAPASAWAAVITRLPCRWSSDPAKDFEAEYTNWTNIAYDAARDRFYLVPWHCVLEALDPVALRWDELTPSLGGGVHNRTLAVDPYNDRMWIGTGTGSFRDPPAPSPTPLAYWDLATRQIVLAGAYGGWGSECACYLDAPRKRFVIYGGWGRLSARTMLLDPLTPTTAGVAPIPWVSHADSDIRSAQKMTHWRGGIDRRRDRALYVDVNGDVWALALATMTWSRVFVGAGVGAPGQPHAMTQFVVDDELDALVGWTSSTAIAGGAVQTPVFKLWLLPLADMQWREVPYTISEPAPNWTYVGFQLAFDPVRRHTLMHGTAGNYNPSTWTIRLARA